MKKFSLILLMCLITILSGCKETQEFDKAEIKNFIMEYKSIIYNVNYDTLLKNNELEEKIRPFISEDVFLRNSKNGVYMLPSNYAAENKSDIKLEDVEVTEITYNKEQENYEVQYLLSLKIDEDSYVKKGKMNLITKEQNPLVTYDWETPINVGNKNFN